jgi:hypothetical protein
MCANCDAHQLIDAGIEIFLFFEWLNASALLQPLLFSPCPLFQPSLNGVYQMSLQSQHVYNVRDLELQK